ncbi:OLC1v1007938C1 [Oldenlandia corymbosa var. corymbosa]|uniref:OLC1v1007938C1 n=1 Tax=Oldenlandia corymbosa var. corymbosa TaxID=529605 RepID=A0AAV1DKM0_OLDCO|nr:OLC1v1007938C1 [Oldenlandia corymbosa var. corymbosa]
MKKRSILKNKNKGAQPALKIGDNVDESGLGVEIIQSNPLFAIGVELQPPMKQVTESRKEQDAQTLAPHPPAKTLITRAPEEIVIARQADSMTGLSSLEKLAIPVDVPDELPPPPGVSNRFVVLETIDESEEDDTVENIFIEDLTIEHTSLDLTIPAVALQHLQNALETITAG